MIVEKTNTGNKIHGVAYGTIRQVNSDGTFKVWIPGVYGIQFEDTPEKLPNAKVLYPPFGSDDAVISMGGPLTVGTKVFCLFENGEITNPVIIGKYYSWSSYQTVASNNQTTLDKQFSFKIGKSLVNLKESGTIEILSLESPEKEETPKAKIVMTSDGSVSLEGENITLNANGILNLIGSNVTVDSKSDVSIKAFSDITMTANNIRANIFGLFTAIKTGIQKLIAGII